MRTALAIVLALVGVAGADDAKRKKTPDKFARAAGEAFTAAVEADQKGDLPTALGLYTKAFTISPHPATAYNIADVHRRQKKVTEAIKFYETYLALSPDAADRAEVERVLDQLAKTPGFVFVASSAKSDPKSIDLSTAYVLFDGKIEIKPGLEPTQTPESGVYVGLERVMPPGQYVVDVITQITHASTTCIVKPGERSICHVSAPPRVDGNVIVSGAQRHVGIHIDPKENRHRDSKHGTRFQLPPGRARLIMRDDRYECPPLVIDAPKGNDVAYVFLETKEPSSFDRCRTFTVTKLRIAL